MDAFRKYFEDNPEIFAALVAFLAIFGSYLAGVRGAKIQAKGGRDQAAAAREAATIAAEAQRVAALWAVRQTQVAEFIQMVRGVVLVAELFYTQNSADEALWTQLGDARKALLRKQGEIELIAPSSVVQAAADVTDCLPGFVQITVSEGQADYFVALIDRDLYGVDVTREELASQAADALRDVRIVRDSADPREQFGPYMLALQALHDAFGTTEEQAQTVIRWTGNSELRAQRAEHKEELDEKMTALVVAAREMLKSEDDVAPTVPAQRRRWGRRAPVSP